MIRVVIVDDHQLVRRGIVAILHDDPGFGVVEETGDGEDALRLIHTTHPDVALVDVRLPEISGIELCYRIQPDMPETAVLILTSYLDSSVVQDGTRLTGAVFVGDISQAGLCRHLIRERVSVAGLKGAIIGHRLHYGHFLQL